jgi:uncharacterized protein (TIGR02145 family)
MKEVTFKKDTMKKNRLFWLMLPAFLMCSLIVKAQGDNSNAGMPIQDVDGNSYKIIMTEEGVWMAENLKTTKYNDGTPIPQIRDLKLWPATKTPAYGWYKPDVNYKSTYGAIYNWYAVKSGKLCPKGWHVPTEAEWTDLMDYAGQAQKSGDNPARLKEKGTAHWKSPNKGATDEIHFTALPAGEASYFYTDAEPGTRTTWWTSTEDKNNLEPGQAPTNAEIVGLSNDFDSRTGGTYEKSAALSVRCKMDD